MKVDTHQNEELLHRIEAHLREDGEHRINRVPKNIHRDIMSAVEMAAPSPQHVKSYRFPMWATALAASGVALLGISQAMWQANEHVARTSVLAELSVYDAQAFELISSVPQRISEPMEREIVYLSDDIQRGSQFLLAQIDYPSVL